jgi:hypothetical protein
MRETKSAQSGGWPRRKLGRAWKVADDRQGLAPVRMETDRGSIVMLSCQAGGPLPSHHWHLLLHATEAVARTCSATLTTLATVYIIARTGPAIVRHCLGVAAYQSTQPSIQLVR